MLVGQQQKTYHHTMHFHQTLILVRHLAAAPCRHPANLQRQTSQCTPWCMEESWEGCLLLSAGEVFKRVLMFPTRHKAEGPSLQVGRELRELRVGNLAGSQPGNLADRSCWAENLPQRMPPVPGCLVLQCLTVSVRSTLDLHPILNKTLTQSVWQFCSLLVRMLPGLVFVALRSLHASFVKKGAVPILLRGIRGIQEGFGRNAHLWRCRHLLVRGVQSLAESNAFDFESCGKIIPARLGRGTCDLVRL